jgi:anaerobic dimethyl sulfoxide reductase subunit A
MNLFGGCLGIYNSYSWGATNIATPTVYGTLVTGNQRQDWLNSRYIIMWGWNPAEMRDGANSDYFVKLARENGARVVCTVKWQLELCTAFSNRQKFHQMSL